MRPGIELGTGDIWYRYDILGGVISYREGVGCFDALVLVELHDGFALPDARTPLDEDANVVARGGICQTCEHSCNTATYPRLTGNVNQKVAPNEVSIVVLQTGQLEEFGAIL